MHPRLSLQNNPLEDIWRYYKLLQISPLAFNDHLVRILQIPFVAKSFQMNIYKVYNLSILHPELQKSFQYILEKDYFASPQMDIILYFSQLNM